MLETRASKLIFILNISWFIFIILFLNFDTKVEVKIESVKLIKSNNLNHIFIAKFNNDDIIVKQNKTSKLELKTRKNKQIAFNVIEFKKIKKNFYQIKINDDDFISYDLKDNLYLVLNTNLLNVIYHN